MTFQDPEHPGKRPLPPPAIPPQWQGNSQQPQQSPQFPQSHQYQQPQFQPQPPQYQQPWQQQPPRRKSWPARHKALTAFLGAGGLVVVIGIAAAAASPPPASSPSGSPVAAPAVTQAAAKAPAAPKAPAKPPAAQTVTYVVTGSSAQVTYGPAGSSLSGTVPLRVTRPLGNPVYYSVTAQLQGGGEVSCEIKVNGKVISSSTATGGYNIAQCEISQDPLSGQWSDTNSG